MGAVVKDRSGETDRRFTSSRKKFMKRQNVKEAIKKAVEKHLGNTDIKNLDKKDVDVSVPQKGLREPGIRHGQGGRTKNVMPGNKQYQKGDKEHFPPGGGGGGNGGPPQPGEPGEGEGEDDFTFVLTNEEFLEMLYEDLQLPNLEKVTDDGATQTEIERQGFKRSGSPTHMDIRRSYKENILRNKVFDAATARKIARILTAQRDLLLTYDPDITEEAIEGKNAKLRSMKAAARCEALEEEVSSLREKYDSVLSDEDRVTLETHDKAIEKTARNRSMMPAWQESDKRFRNYEEKPIPNCKAVMFCMMDVSGSVDQEMKNNSKLFTWVLHNFLHKNYDQVDVVFLRHTTDAEEVDEQTFFYDPKSGGTKVSPVLELMKEIMDERYPTNEWNIYATQTTDGDNPQNDNGVCARLLDEMLPDIQGYFYLEVSSPSWGNSSWAQAFWNTYKQVAEKNPSKFYMGKLKERSDILPVFHKFFEKREGKDNQASPIIAALTP